MSTPALRALLGSGGISTALRKRDWTEALDGFLGDVDEVLFVPYALADHDAYVTAVTERGLSAGRKLTGIHRAQNPKEAVCQARALYVGGGNSFRLLHALYAHDLLDVIRRRALSGELAYIGVSAGTNMACPTLKTTNDMPIVMPPSFDALGLVSFQINPHFFSGPLHFKDATGDLTPYAGETREDRIREFHEMNTAPVLGLWEGAVLQCVASEYRLLGHAGARLFERGTAARDFSPGERLPLT